MFPLLATSSIQGGPNRYWRGGAGSWNGTAGSKWAYYPSGSVGAPEPTSSDNVFFDAGSGAVTVSITISTANCLNIDFTGFTGTFSGSTAIDIYGSLLFSSGMTRTHTGAISFKATTVGNTITLNGKTLASNIVFDGVGGEWTIQDSFLTTGGITITNGNVIAIGKTITCGTFSGTGSNLRGLDITNSTVNCSVTGWLFTTTTNLTLVTTGSTINAANSNFVGGGLIYNTLNMTGITASHGLTGVNSYTGNLSIVGGANYATVTVADPQTVSGNITFTGNNTGSQRLFIASNTLSAPVTITCNGSVSLTNVDLQLITASGSATWSGTSVGDCTGNTGITFTPAVTRYVVHPGGSVDFMSTTLWSASSGGATGASPPLVQDTPVMDGSSFAGAGCTIAAAAAYRMPGLDFTNATNSPTLNLSASGAFYSFFGNLAFISAMTLSGSISSAMYFRGYATNISITSAGKTIPGNLRVESSLGTVSLNDAMIIANTLTVTQGTWDDNDFAVTIGAVVLTGTATRSVLKGTATYSLTGTGVVWSGATTGITFTDTGTTKLTNNSASAKSFTGGGLIYNNWWNATQGNGVTTLSSSNTFADIKIDAGRTQQFSGATTTTLATLTAVGTAGNLITIAGVASVNYNIVSSSGTTINTNYISISHCQASGATWNAGANSVNGGNNSGITF